MVKIAEREQRRTGTSCGRTPPISRSGRCIVGMSSHVRFAKRSKRRLGALAPQGLVVLYFQRTRDRIVRVFMTSIPHCGETRRTMERLGSRAGLDGAIDLWRMISVKYIGSGSRS